MSKKYYIKNPIQPPVWPTQANTHIEPDTPRIYNKILSMSKKISENNETMQANCHMNVSEYLS